MSREHSESLREQVITAISLHTGWEESAVELFDKAIWPVLDKAMSAGELLVARNTEKQRPVNEAIALWVQDVVSTVERLRSMEHTVSKRNLLDALYMLQESASVALRDVSAVSPTDMVQELIRNAHSQS